MPDRDAAGQWQEFIAGAVYALGAAAFGVPVPPAGDVVQVCALVVPNAGMLDELFALRDCADPAEFERSWAAKSAWSGMELNGQRWARLDVQVRTPLRAVTRLVMDVGAMRPVLTLAVEGRALFLVREKSLQKPQTPAALLSESLPVFQGRSSALEALLA